jgi:hypothetical protein
VHERRTAASDHQPAFEIRFEATDEYLKRELTRYWIQYLIRLPLTWILIAVLLWGVYEYATGDTAYGTRLVLGAALCCGILLFHVRKNLRLVRDYHAHLPNRMTIVRFFGSYLQDESADQTLNIPWKFILKVRRWRGAWFLFFSKNQFYMLPTPLLTEPLRLFINERVSHGNKTDFLRCRHCRFNLVGCAQQTCPKCGRRLPFGEMDIPPEQFYELTSALDQGLAGKVFRRKLRLVSRTHCWPAWLIGLIGGLSGFLTVGTLVVTASLFPLVSVVAVVVLTLPPAIIAIISSRIESGRRILIFGLGHGVVFAGLLGLLCAVAMLSGSATGLTVWTVVQVCVYGATLPIAIGWGVWGICERIRGKPVQAEAFKCSVCGYALIGNLSGACPECGTAIAYERMGISKPQFDALASQTAEHDARAD